MHIILFFVLYFCNHPLICINDELQRRSGGDLRIYCRVTSETTIRSMSDAAILLRVGGLLSIMTYPASNMEESVVVERFIEGLGMLTTRDKGGWTRTAYPTI
jgi:hypothetical protein